MSGQLIFPFKDIVEQRPYPATGLTTARWNNEIKIQAVPLSNLILTQRGVYIDKLFRPLGTYKAQDTPKVVLWQGNFYLEDGHHRVTSAALQGHKSIRARVFIFPLDTPVSLTYANSMNADDMVISYGTTGAEMECPECGSAKFRIDLPYPFATLGVIRFLADKHIDKEHADGNF